MLVITSPLNRVHLLTKHGIRDQQKFKEKEHPFYVLTRNTKVY